MADEQEAKGKILSVGDGGIAADKDEDEDDLVGRVAGGEGVYDTARGLAVGMGWSGSSWGKCLRMGREHIETVSHRISSSGDGGML